MFGWSGTHTLHRTLLFLTSWMNFGIPIAFASSAASTSALPAHKSDNVVLLWCDWNWTLLCCYHFCETFDACSEFFDCLGVLGGSELQLVEVLWQFILNSVLYLLIHLIDALETYFTCRIFGIFIFVLIIHHHTSQWSKSWRVPNLFHILGCLPMFSFRLHFTCLMTMTTSISM